MARSPPLEEQGQRRRVRRQVTGEVEVRGEDVSALGGRRRGRRGLAPGSTPGLTSGGGGGAAGAAGGAQAAEEAEREVDGEVDEKTEDGGTGLHFLGLGMESLSLLGRARAR